MNRLFLQTINETLALDDDRRHRMFTIEAENGVPVQPVSQILFHPNVDLDKLLFELQRQIRQWRIRLTDLRVETFELVTSIDADVWHNIGYHCNVNVHRQSPSALSAQAAFEVRHGTLMGEAIIRKDPPDRSTDQRSILITLQAKGQPLCLSI